MKRTATKTVSEPTTMAAHIRWMIRRDLPDVLEVESRSYEDPWTERHFLKCLSQRNCVGMVIEVDERVVGFMIYDLHAKFLHIINFAVHPDFRMNGLGRKMVAKLVSKLSSHRRTQITLKVRESNLTAHKFFRACGFKATQVLRGFYRDSDEDAYAFTYSRASSQDDRPYHSEDFAPDLGGQG